jgi:hypothetical protein
MLSFLNITLRILWQGAHQEAVNINNIGLSAFCISSIGICLTDSSGGVCAEAGRRAAVKSTQNIIDDNTYENLFIFMHFYLRRYVNDFDL